MTSTGVPGKRRREQLIEEAIVDCYGEEEQATGLFTMIEDNLALPFRTTFLGVTVDVVGVDMNDNGRVVAICKDGKHRQRIALADLPLPAPPPAGSEWIAAYRHWAKQRGWPGRIARSCYVPSMIRVARPNSGGIDGLSIREPQCVQQQRARRPPLWTSGRSIGCGRAIRRGDC